MPLFATAARAATPDPLALAILAAGLLYLCIALLRKRSARKKAAVLQAVPAVPAEEASSPAGEAPVAPGSAGELKLHNVDPRTAAMLMAIVADAQEKPLNQLRFLSIREITGE